MGLDVGFLVLLLLTTLTGLLVLALRETPAMGTLLAIHLGAVAGFFLTLPYGKFAHVVYRYVALVRNSIEQGHTDPLLPEYTHTAGSGAPEELQSRKEES